MFPSSLMLQPATRLPSTANANFTSAPNTNPGANAAHEPVLPSALSHAQTPFTIPQHLHFNPMNPLNYRRSGQDETPHIFSNMPLRRGKWTTEEERYANAIIEAFEKGTIQNCENGCTLRAYLSRKLHCQPMRISKKYAGKSIGKQVFLSRLNVAPGREIVSSNTQTLKQLEFQFHMSVVQEGITSNMDSMNGAASSSLHQYSAPDTKTAWSHNATPHHNPQIATVTAFPPMTHVVHGVNNVQARHPTLNYQMQQNLFNAFKQAQTQTMISLTDTKGPVNDTRPGSSSSGSKTVSKITSSESDGNNISSKCQGETVSADATPKEVSSSQAQQNWINETMAIIPTLDPTNYTGRFSPTYTSKSFDDLHQFIGNDCPPNHEYNDKPKTRPNLKPVYTAEGPATEAANQIERVANLGDSASQTSPKICCEGARKDDWTAKGLMPSPLTFRDPVSINASDEYAFYAQQSAMEASKHSAYCRREISPAANKGPTNAHISSRVPIQNYHSQPGKRTSRKTTFSHPIIAGSMSTFNTANLKMHSKATAAADGTLHGNHIGTQLESVSVKLNTTTDLHRHTRAPLVSGSERSSDMGTEGSAMSSSGSGSSGSDNDNSDCASESTGSLQNGKRKSTTVSGSMQGEGERIQKIAKLNDGELQ